MRSLIQARSLLTLVDNRNTRVKRPSLTEPGFPLGASRSISFEFYHRVNRSLCHNEFTPPKIFDKYFFDYIMHFII